MFMGGTNASGYVVTKEMGSCKKCTDSDVCKKDECRFVCRHMYTCTCYEYNNGHICKHVHRIHSLYLTSHSNPVGNDSIDGNGINQPQMSSSNSSDDNTSEDHIPGVTIITKSEHSGNAGEVTHRHLQFYLTLIPL